MNATSNNWRICMSVILFALIGSVGAVERPNLSFDERARSADFVVVADVAGLMPFIGQEFDKFYRVQVRVAAVLKGNVTIGDHLEVRVDQTIAEQRNNCCDTGAVYVLFLRRRGAVFHFVGSPLGAIPVEFVQRPGLQPPIKHHCHSARQVAKCG